MTVVDRPAPPSATSTRVLVAALAWLVTVAVANTGATAVAQPAIQRAFGVGPATVGWVVFGYTAAFAISTAWYGSVARRVGAAPAIAVGAGLLAVGAAVCATAPSAGVLVGARVLQGLGAGAIPTLSFTIMAERLEGARLARAVGLIVVGVGAGQAVGPLLGGVAADLVSWRAAVALGLATLPAIPVVIRLHDGPRDPSARLDVVGALQVAVLVGAATWVLNRAPLRGLGPVVVTVAVVGALALVATARHVRRRPDAFVPLRVVARPGFASRVVFGALLMGVWTAVLTGVPLVAGEAVDGAVALGLVLLPMAAAVATASAGVDRLPLPADGRAVVVLGLVVLAAAAGLAGVVVGGAPAPVVAVALVPVGLSYGLVAVPLTSQVGELFPGPDRSLALGAYHVGFFVGGAVGGSVVAAAIDRTAPAGAVGFRAVLLGLATLTLVAAAGVVAGRWPADGDVPRKKFSERG